jgi:hypothetical protein
MLVEIIVRGFGAVKRALAQVHFAEDSRFFCRRFFAEQELDNFGNLQTLEFARHGRKPALTPQRVETLTGRQDHYGSRLNNEAAMTVNFQNGRHDYRVFSSIGLRRTGARPGRSASALSRIDASSAERFASVRRTNTANPLLQVSHYARCFSQSSISRLGFKHRLLYVSRSCSHIKRRINDADPPIPVVAAPIYF